MTNDDVERSTLDAVYFTASLHALNRLTRVISLRENIWNTAKKRKRKSRFADSDSDSKNYSAVKLARLLNACVKELIAIKKLTRIHKFCEVGRLFDNGINY